jgi:ABC-2 type transport system permease protein
MSEPRPAEIYDLGYRAYDGMRRAPAWALVTLGLHTLQRVLGLRRPFRHKILPGLTVVIAFVPALVFVGLAAFLPKSLIEEDILPSYAEYTGFVTGALVLFASFVAPEALCTDRRTGMLDLYLAGPLDVRRYLLAKWASVWSVMLLLTVGPELFMFAAFTIEGAGPSAGDLPLLLVRIVVAGAATALLYTAIAMGVSSLTTRKAVAAVATVLLLFVPAIGAGVAIESADAPDALSLLRLADVPEELGYRIYGETRGDDVPIASVATWSIVVGFFGWVVAGVAASALGYRRGARR